MFKKILIANRGEIACRVIQTARRMGIDTVAVHSDADATRRMSGWPTRRCGSARRRRTSPTSSSTRSSRRSAAPAPKRCIRATDFSPRTAKFAEALKAEGVAFVGPPPSAIEAMGDKITSKKLAAEAGVTTVPGYMGLIADADEAAKIAGEIGYPVMIKASAGGGGKGMRIAWNEREAREGFGSLAQRGEVQLRRRPHLHREVRHPAAAHRNPGAGRPARQLRLPGRAGMLDPAPQPEGHRGGAVALPRRRDARAMGEQACALAQAVGYTSAGTVEFIVDGDRNFYFLEMNTRLQVEHPVTELITGIDLVEQMLRVAAGEQSAVRAGSDIRLDGWAIESRLYAEDPYRNFLPSIGRLTRYRPPQEVREATRAVRNDTGVEEGGEISMYYDPMIAKLCTWGPDRAAAIEHMRDALDAFEVEGIGHNLPFLAAVMDHPRFVAGEITTAFIAEEFPDGFSGVVPDDETLRRIAAAAAAMHRVAEIRRTRISGRMDNHERKVGTDWVVEAAGRRFELTISADREARRSASPTARRAASPRTGSRASRSPGSPSTARPLTLKVGKITDGYRIRIAAPTSRCMSARRARPSWRR